MSDDLFDRYKYQYEFYGVVHPERSKFFLKGVPPARIILVEDFGIEGGIVTFESENSRLKATLFSNDDFSKLPQDAITTARNYIARYSRFHIDAYCYLRSLNYDLEIVEVKCEKLKFQKTFDVQLEMDILVETEKDIAKINSHLSEMVNLLNKRPEIFFLRNVFADFRRGIKYPSSSGFFFYRAVETIRSNHFDDFTIRKIEKRKKLGWKKMHEALNTNEREMGMLLEFSKPARHGVYLPIKEEERLACAKEARHFIDVFIEYLQNR